MLQDVRSENESLRSLELRLSGPGAEACRNLLMWGFAFPQAESPQTCSQACEENVRNSWHEGIFPRPPPEA